ncbi:MAG: mono/diheme cytochrome c family protein [Kiritimatiellia bacterium]
MKKKIGLAAGVIGALGVGLALVGFVYVQMTWDRDYSDTPYPALTTSTDPTVIALGKYLVTGPAHCSNCHVGSYDEFMQADAGKALPLSGGWTFPIGPLGAISTRNLTPDPTTGIGRFEDKELFRMMRHNVKPDGRASLAPMMPFSRMADDDLVAVISYLRSLDPVQKEIPGPRWNFLAKMMFALAPPAPFQPIVGHEWPKKAPPQEPTVERGEYLANSVANCLACHSPISMETFEIEGAIYSGSKAPEPTLTDPSIGVRAPNLTDHPTGRLSKFKTEDAWVARFRAGRIIPESFMHWGPFSRMSEADLIAIYRYLKTVPPVDNDTGPAIVKLD